MKEIESKFWNLETLVDKDGTYASEKLPNGLRWDYFVVFKGQELTFNLNLYISMDEKS